MDRDCSRRDAVGVLGFLKNGFHAKTSVAKANIPNDFDKEEKRGGLEKTQSVAVDPKVYNRKLHFD